MKKMSGIYLLSLVMGMLLLLPSASYAETGLGHLAADAQNNWFYVDEEGKVVDFTGFVEYDGGLFYLTNGILAKDTNGFIQDPANSSDWYFVASGQVVTAYSGLIYGIPLEYFRNLYLTNFGADVLAFEWWNRPAEGIFVENGKWDSDFTGITEYCGECFVIRNGIFQFTYGQQEINGETYLTSMGRVCKMNFLYFAFSNVGYYYQDGRVKKEFTGIVEYPMYYSNVYDRRFLYVENGVCDPFRSGIVDCGGEEYYIENGAVISEANGLTQIGNSSEWYLLNQGRVSKTVTTLVQYDGAWFYVINGKLASDYTGTVWYDQTEFLIVDGMVR